MGTAFSIAFAPLVSSRTCLVWFLFKHWPVEKGPRAPLSDHPTYNKKMSVGITQASSGHDCFRLLGAVNLLPFMQIQRSLRLALVCRKWVTAVLALAIHHVLSNQGLILSTCSFMKSLQKKKKKKNGAYACPKWTGPSVASWDLKIIEWTGVLSRIWTQGRQFTDHWKRFVFLP